MKTLLIIATLILVLASCTKHTGTATPEHVKAHYKVMAIGISGDTASTPWMYAKVEPPKYVDYDDYLMIELVGFTNGQYILKVTNPQHCDVDFKLEYEGITVTAITPNRKNNLYVNQVKAGKSELFYIAGSKKLGKIKAKALTICNWQGCEPAWLSVDITAAILPVNYLSYKTSYSNHITTISFTVANPDEADKFVITKLIDGAEVVIDQVKCDKVTKSYSLNYVDKK